MQLRVVKRSRTMQFYTGNFIKKAAKRQLFSGNADCPAGNYNWMGLP